MWHMYFRFSSVWFFRCYYDITKFNQYAAIITDISHNKLVLNSNIITINTIMKWLFTIKKATGRGRRDGRSNSSAALHAHLRRYMGAARLRSRFLNCIYEHTADLLHAAAVSQTAYKYSSISCSAITGYINACTQRLLPCYSNWIPNCMHTVAK
jgi:hypothetical protein